MLIFFLHTVIKPSRRSQVPYSKKDTQELKHIPGCNTSPDSFASFSSFLCTSSNPFLSSLPPSLPPSFLPSVNIWANFCVGPGARFGTRETNKNRHSNGETNNCGLTQCNKCYLTLISAMLKITGGEYN